LRTLIEEMSRYSRFLQRDCAAHSLLYIDGSNGFEQAIDSGLRYLASA
jgi:hypothetical protein